MFLFFDLFPMPAGIFAPVGTSLYLNRALLDFTNIKDASLIVGKYNLLTDPVVNCQLGMAEDIQRVFRGETVVIAEFSPPVQDLFDSGVIKEKPFESAIMDIYLYPIRSEDKLAYVVCVLIVKSVYQGTPDAAKAKEYIDIHWREAYDQYALAKSLNMSISQLYNIFKELVGVAPGDYYKQVKVDHIKKKLQDKNLTISEAFAACGEDSRGWIAKVFKEITGYSPRAYRAKIK
jgi:AraC-like DNA-binding protein